ncbi:MAG: TRAP transporter substrate-binding protein [Burkholderiales bacterium]|nr:TRAP transporter substrate-binding protein [Burkholderiales bacterium]
MSRRVGTTLALVAGAAAVLGMASGAKAQELRLSTFVPPVHVIYREIITPWAQEIAKATNGEVKITLYPSMQLGGKPPDLYRQSVQGAVDFVFTLPGYTSPAFPRVQMIELPGLMPDGVAATNMMWDLLDPYLLPDFEGTKVIALWGAEDAGWMSRSGAFKTMDDLKGKRMRAPSAAQAKQLEVMGAVPIAMPITQVYQNLERGVIDGAMLPFSTIVDFRLGEVGKGITVTGPLFGRSSFLISMNKQKYDSLSPAARAAIDKTSGRGLSLKATEVYLKRAESGIQSIKGKAEVYTLPPAEQARIAEVLKPIVADWIKQNEAKGVPARDMLRKAGYPVN